MPSSEIDLGCRYHFPSFYGFPSILSKHDLLCRLVYCVHRFSPFAQRIRNIESI